MRRISGWIARMALVGVILPGVAVGQTPAGNTVRAAAENFAAGVSWRAASLLEADFSCSGKVQQALLGSSEKEIVVAIFTDGLHRAPALLRFETDARNIYASKIRVDDYNLTAEEIAGVTGTAPVGYRQSATCHGVRLSDDTYEAAHIYWDHEHQKFDSWAQ